MTQQAHPLRYSVHTRLRQFHLGQLMPKGGGRLLDVGCGVGYMMRALGNGYECVGLEYDFEALKSNRENGLPNMARASAGEIPFKTASFDVVVCSELLEHMPGDEDGKVLSEIGRVTKPGGRVFITVPALEGLRATTPLRNLGHDIPGSGEYHHKIGYSWDQMNRLIADTGVCRVVNRRYSTVILSELFMDLLKLVYLKKNKMKEQSDLMKMNDSPLFKIYRLAFPFLHAVFVAEDFIASPALKGHILVVEVERV